MDSRRKNDGEDIVFFVIVFLVACCVLGVLYLNYHSIALYGLAGLVTLAVLVKLFRVEYWDNFTVLEFCCFLPVMLSVYWIVDIEYPQSVLDSAKSIERFDGMEYVIESVKLTWHTALNIKVIVLSHILALGVIVTTCIANVIATHRESSMRSAGLIFASVVSMLLANLNFAPTWLYHHFQI
ncbi:hypothetical protein VSVS12_01128 [Vibrio scophthalmi]|uniref:hypothetical protein n=1 Tax=Vibrio scophthalmi TaxID=45658 RepID=UPI0008096C59|nr:hypothetical protein [Vibrio scophthalmi]ANS84895.1 hypothetical protein VSVS12_01128 [Vibrio scophthalmi]